jgi:hypothetical protein
MNGTDRRAGMSLKTHFVDSRQEQSFKCSFLHVDTHTQHTHTHPSRLYTHAARTVPGFAARAELRIHRGREPEGAQETPGPGQGRVARRVEALRALCRPDAWHLQPAPAPSLGPKRDARVYNGAPPPPQAELDAEFQRLLAELKFKEDQVSELQVTPRSPE